MLLNRPFFLSLVAVVLCCQSIAAGPSPLLFGANHQSAGPLYSVNPETGAMSYLGDLGVDLREIAGDTRPGRQKIWGVTEHNATSATQLVEIDPFAVKVLSVKTLPETITTIAIHPETGELYGTKYGPGLELYSIDRDTGALTVVGLIPIKFHTLAFKGDGTLYGADFARTYEIDYNDTSGQYLGFTEVSRDFDKQFVSDMEFHPDSHLAYGDNGRKQLIAIDTQASVTSTVGALDVGMQMLAFIRAISGDFDTDGDVDGVDLAEMFANFNGPGGGPPTNPDTDLDGDGDVDGVDITRFFGEFTGPLAPVNVPEPGTIGLIVLSGLLLARRRL